jgi:DmsE family decaheme c-type cytochrome
MREVWKCLSSGAGHTLVLIAAITIWSPLPVATALPVSGDYIGSSVCKGCHPNVWLNFYKNPHYQSTADGTEPPALTGCEGCHGPGKAHVEGHGDKSKITAFSSLLPAQVLDRCLTCHSRQFPRVNIRNSAHTNADVVCTNCHSIHKSNQPRYLLANVQREVCYGCHGTVRAQFDMPVKHRVNEGAMQCTDCHNPHGSFAPTWRMGIRPRLMQQTMGNEEPCLKCHTDKRGPFVFEHETVRVDGCESCHNAHGSTNAKLLKRPVVWTLCLECHNGAGNYGAGATGVARQAASHNMLDPRFQRCTNCHVRIHGSNTDPVFLR